MWTQVTNQPTTANSSHVRSFFFGWFSHPISHYDTSIIWKNENATGHERILSSQEDFNNRHESIMWGQKQGVVYMKISVWSTQDAAWKCCVWKKAENRDLCWTAETTGWVIMIDVGHNGRRLRLELAVRRIYTTTPDYKISRCPSLTPHFHPTFRRA